MKSFLLSSFIIIISLGICEAQTSTNTSLPVRQNTRVESVTTKLTQQLSLSPAQIEQVKNLYQQNLQQIQHVVETNKSDKHLANDQIQTLIQQRETSLQTILTPTQFNLYRTSGSK
ncbi:MAG: hypothetical protein D4R43_03430 [Sphingobacteriales bacterium]|nr:MAG: hypothetical protein D4R43_03430 [Sphingobacteriales bacterium]